MSAQQPFAQRRPLPADANVVLIGYRGCGKTTVAQALAARLDRPWFDADVELEARAGRTIAQIFAEQGEPAFRDLESQVLNDLCARRGLIIAAGGGAVLREENRRRLRDGGRVVWLQADPATIAARIDADPTTHQRRPNLTAQGGVAEIERLLAQRRPLYEACADCSISTTDRDPQAIISQIISLLSL